MPARPNKRTLKRTVGTIGDVVLGLIVLTLILWIVHMIDGARAFEKLDGHILESYPVGGWLALGAYSALRFRSRVRSYRENGDEDELGWSIHLGVITFLCFAFAMFSAIQTYAT